MVFFTLTVKDYFGGRILLINNDRFFEHDSDGETGSDKMVSQK